MKLSILNARLIDASCDLDGTSNIYIEDDKISSIGTAPSNWSPDESIDATGLIATAGFIDIGTNLGSNKDGLLSETNAAYAGGYTSLAISPSEHNSLDNSAVLQSLLDKAQNLIHLAPIAGITKDLAGKVLTDMGALKIANCVGVSNARFNFADLNIMALALKYAKGMDLKVFFYPEDKDLKDNGVMHQGKVSIKMGLAGIPVSAETISLSRDLILIQEIGVKSHFCGISAAASLDILQHARDLGVDFSADVSMANLVYTHNEINNYDTNFHLEPPLRTSFDREELVKAVNSGKIEVITSGHTPVEIAYKNAPFAETRAGMSNLETAFSMGFSLVLNKEMQLAKLIQAMNANPAKTLGFANRGSLKAGNQADIVLIDANKKWTPKATTWKSYGTNNPLIGKELQAKIKTTLASGKIQHNEL